MLTSVHNIKVSVSHNTHKRQTSMPPAGFEPTMPARERPQPTARPPGLAENESGNLIEKEGSGRGLIKNLLNFDGPIDKTTDDCEMCLCETLIWISNSKYGDTYTWCSILYYTHRLLTSTQHRTSPPPSHCQAVDIVTFQCLNR